MDEACRGSGGVRRAAGRPVEVRPGRPLNVDLLVVGSGAAGLTAAIAARLRGLAVLVVEKEPFWGGATAVSGGAIWAPGNSIAARMGVPDDLALARQYLAAACGNRLDRERAEVFLQAVGPTVDFLEANTALRFVGAKTYPDYYAHLPGASLGGRLLRAATWDASALGPHFATLRPPLAETMVGGMSVAAEDVPHLYNWLRRGRSFRYVGGLLARYLGERLQGAPRGWRVGNGNAMAACLGKTAFDLGAMLWLKAPVVRLTWADGRVAGAVVRRDGGEVQVTARAGVVLATGGFAHDPELQRRFMPHVAAGGVHQSLIPDGSTGDGMRLAESVGAAWDAGASDAAVWVPTSRYIRADGRAVPFAHLIDRAKPGFIMVGPDGRRFASEALVYQSFVPALIRAASAAAAAADPHAWLIGDARAIRRYGIGAVRPWPSPIGRHLASGYLKRAQTIGGLAGAIGVAGDVLAGTIERFNANASRGEDPDFGRGGDAYERFMGDPAHAPNPCLAPLAEAPFFAVRIVPGDVGTFVGVRTDGGARALDAEGRPVPGLCVAGNDLASIFGGEYPGGGSTLGPALVFGRIAAETLADELAAGHR